MLLRYTCGDEERLVLVNLGRRTTLRMNDPLLAPASRQLQWTTMSCSERAVYGGAGAAPLPPEGMWALHACCAWLLRGEPTGTEVR